jgi:hypothetical protein
MSALENLEAKQIKTNTDKVSAAAGLQDEALAEFTLAAGRPGYKSPYSNADREGSIGWQNANKLPGRYYDRSGKYCPQGQRNGSSCRPY